MKPLTPAQRASDVRTAIANQITLIVWRLQSIIEVHLGSNDSHYKPDHDEEYGRSVSTYDPHGTGTTYISEKHGDHARFDKNGFYISQPLILTAIDVIPVTKQQACALLGKAHLVHVLHIGPLQGHLCDYGRAMLKLYRADGRFQTNKRTKQTAKKLANGQQDRSQLSVHVVGSKPESDPLEVTCTESEFEALEESEHVAIGMSWPDSDANESWEDYDIFRDRLMRHRFS